jgi:hypothetical protein
MLDAFYDGTAIHDIVREGDMTPREFEILLRGYIIGLRAQGLDDGDDEDDDAV